MTQLSGIGSARLMEGLLKPSLFRCGDAWTFGALPVPTLNFPGHPGNVNEVNQVNERLSLYVSNHP